VGGSKAGKPWTLKSGWIEPSSLIAFKPMKATKNYQL